jgi:hypothetical protein
MARTVFFDESGTTGSDYFHADTPHMITAAVLLDASTVADVSAKLDDLRTQNRVQSKGELKYATLRKSNTGLGLVRDLGRLLDEHSVAVNYTAVEKHFNVCAMVVETYLDPTLNRLAPPENNPELRQEFANVIGETISDSTLRDFVAAAKADDVPELTALGKTIANRLELHFARLKHVAAAFRLGADNPFRLGEMFESEPRRHNIPTPLTHAFIPTMVHLNMFLDDQGYDAHLVADDDAQFGELFDRLFVLPSNRGFGPDPFLEFVGSIDTSHIKSYTRVASESSVGVQLADLCAGIAREVAFVRSRGGVVQSALADAWQPFARCKSRSSSHFMMLSATGLKSGLFESL